MNKLFKTMTDAEKNAVYEFPPQQDNQPVTQAPYTKVIVNDLVRKAYIGVYDFEKNQAQQIKINLEVLIDPIIDWKNDNHEDTVCYARMVEHIDKLISEGHINLVETFAEKIAQDCLSNSKVQSIKVRIEKTEIIDNCAGAGVEIFRSR